MSAGAQLAASLRRQSCSLKWLLSVCSSMYRSDYPLLCIPATAPALSCCSTSLFPSDGARSSLACFIILRSRGCRHHSKIAGAGGDESDDLGDENIIRGYQRPQHRGTRPERAAATNNKHQRINNESNHHPLRRHVRTRDSKRPRFTIPALRQARAAPAAPPE